MSVREWVNNNSAVVTIVAVLLLCFALAFTIWQSGGSGHTPPTHTYYFDPSTGEIFVDEVGGVYPPIETPSGNEDGVRAHIFSCGDCPDNLEGMTLEEVEEAGAFVAYFTRYAPEAREVLMRPDEDLTDMEREQQMMAADEGQEVRHPDGSRWYSLYSGQGDQISAAAFERCREMGERPTHCRP